MIFTTLVPARGPARSMVITTLINSLGTGAYLSTAFLYFTHVVGMPAVTVGSAFAASGAAALLVSVPLGYLSDRAGPRRLAIGMSLLEAVAMGTMIFVRTPWQLAVAAFIALAGEQGSRTLRNIILGHVGGPHQVRLRAQVRATGNLGLALGAATGGFAIFIDSPIAFASVLAGNGTTFLVAALLIMRLPHYPPVAVSPGGRRLPVLRDWRFGLVAALYGIMTLQVGTLSFAVPLWIVTATDTPTWMAAVTLIINTALVVALQVRASAHVVDPPSAGRSMRRAGFAFLVCYVALATAGRGSAWTASIILMIAAAVYTLGELWQAAAGFELAFGLAPRHAVGQYQGLFDLAVSAVRAVAPAVVVALCVEGGQLGWIAFGLLMLCTGLAAPLAVRMVVSRQIGTRLVTP